MRAAVIALLLILVIVIPAMPSEVKADTPWLSGWSYRKGHQVNQTAGAGTNYQVKLTLFYDEITRWFEVGEPNYDHVQDAGGNYCCFTPVANSSILKFGSLTINGTTPDYIAYLNRDWGLELWYTDNLDGAWTNYTGKLIMYHWSHSVAYVNGTFHMFVFNKTTDPYDQGYTDRWESTDAINYTWKEHVAQANGDPFIWQNPNDMKWYLYTTDSPQPSAPMGRRVFVRSSSNITLLGSASPTTLYEDSHSKSNAGMMYHDGTYFLVFDVGYLSEYEDVVFMSSSPDSGFVRSTDSPMLKMSNGIYIYKSPDGGKGYMHYNLLTPFTDWAIRQREIYFDSYLSLSSHSRTDFGDVRFTTSDGTTLLNYWMQEKVNGDSAVFWVKIPSDLSTATRTIYVYWGNSLVTTTSDGDYVFLFFDDFSGESIDTSKWTVTGTIAVSGGLATLDNGDKIVGKTDIALSSMTVFRDRRTDNTKTGYFALLDNGTTTIQNAIYWYSDYYYAKAMNDSGNECTIPSNCRIRIMNSTLFQDWGIERRTNYSHYYQNTTLLKSHANYIDQSPETPWVWVDTAGQSIVIDFIYVRKAANLEPRRAWLDEEEYVPPEEGGGHVSLKPPSPLCTYNRLSGGFDCVDVQDYGQMLVLKVRWTLDGGDPLYSPPNGKVSLPESGSFWSPSALTHTIYSTAIYQSGSEVTAVLHVQTDDSISPILVILIVCTAILVLAALKRRKR